jgi:hypothetical protein
LQEDTAARADASSAVTRDGPDTVEAGELDSADVGQFQSTFAEALRADGTTARKSTSGAPGSGDDGGQSSAGIALYKRVSQIGNNESSPSALLKSWNSIVQGGSQDGGDAAAATLQAHLQGASGFGSRILDVTA